MKKRISINCDIIQLDYNSAVNRLKKLFSDNIAVNMALKLAGSKTAESIVLNILNMNIANSVLKKKTEKFLNRYFYNLQVTEIRLKNEKGDKNIMKFNLDCNIENIDEVLEFLSDKIRIHDENTAVIVRSAIKSVIKNVSDESKTKIVNDIAEQSSEEIAALISKQISKKLFTVELSNVKIKAE